jgi:hypothetical protein
MIKATVFERDGSAVDIDVYPTLQHALRDLRQHWLESVDPSERIIVSEKMAWETADDHWRLMTTLTRDADDPSVMIAWHADGFVERHRCEYVYGADCRYLHTKVTALVA